jgi:two-component system, NtrC family, response regulator AtoC
MGRILIVDNDASVRRMLAVNLRPDQHEIWEACDVQEAHDAWSTDEFDVVITELRMPDGNGLAVLRDAHESDPTLSVILLTAADSIKLTESMQEGAFDFLTKPFQPEVARATVIRACQRTRLMRENIFLKDAVLRLEGASEIYGKSDAIREVRERIARLAPTSTTVLITGEIGTGKALVARAIHRNSPRAAKPLVGVNCAAFREARLESELFGHEKGAFIGADRRRPGLFEAAHEGTLFLDEAGDMSSAVQAKFLRILTSGELLPVGSTRPRSVNVRVVVASQCNLEERVKRGLYREDLLYRLAVAPIHLPPLRDRVEDIPGLCDMFSKEIATELKMPRRPLSTPALQKLRKYPFPGNLRELKNLIERAYILSSNTEIAADDLLLAQKDAAVLESKGNGEALAIPRSQNFDLTGFLEHAEKSLILRTLNATHGAQSEAARRMGLSRSALAYKLNKYGIRGETATKRLA